jgi:hypothetical protein
MSWRRQFEIVVLGSLLSVCVAGCGAREAELASHGKVRLTGLSQSEVRMCAGFPAKNEKDKRGEIWMYEHGASMPGGFTVPAVGLPWGASLNSSTPNGYCRVQFRFVGGRIAEVSYAGETDLWGHRDAVCAQIVRNCLDRVAARSGNDVRR